MGNFIIDISTKAIDWTGKIIETSDKRRLISRLRRLTWVIKVCDGGEYHEDRAYSQVWLKTNRKEDEIDKWLWKYSNVDYVGVVETDKELFE